MATEAIFTGWLGWLRRENTAAEKDHQGLADKIGVIKVNLELAGSRGWLATVLWERTEDDR
jgi:hypothetical protein